METQNTQQDTQTLEELEKIKEELEIKKQELEKMKNEIEDYENKKVALEKELSRVQEQIKSSREEKRKKDEELSEKLRAENLEKAKSKIISEFGYQDKEKLNTLLEVFNKIDDGSLTEDKIYNSLLQAHLILNSNKYIEIEKKLKEMGKSAEDLVKDLSTSSMEGINKEQTEDLILTKEDIEAAKWAGIPLERYKELKLKGKI
ncbi:MAG: hypothetical protein QW469_00520 [Candidatus Aenigmatarchaeota archaeon]